VNRRKRQNDESRLHEVTRSRTSKQYPTLHPHYILTEFFASWPLYPFCVLLECGHMSQLNKVFCVLQDSLHNTAPRIMAHLWLCRFLCVAESFGTQFWYSLFLGAFAKFRKVTLSLTISVFLSVRPSVRPSVRLQHETTRLPLDGFLRSFMLVDF
jgi:hypothetical protein